MGEAVGPESEAPRREREDNAERAEHLAHAMKQDVEDAQQLDAMASVDRDRIEHSADWLAQNALSHKVEYLENAASASRIAAENAAIAARREHDTRRQTNGDGEPIE